MNEEIHCITNKEKTAKNKWKNDDSDFLQALDSMYKKINLFKQRYISSVKKKLKKQWS